MAKKTDRKLDEILRNQDKLVDGQSQQLSVMNDFGEKLSRIENSLDKASVSGDSGYSASVRESLGIQETDKDRKKLNKESNKEPAPAIQGGTITKLSVEMPLKELWAKQGFQDEFSKEMNVKYHKTNSKHWPYLAEKFKIKRDKIDELEVCDYASPSESMVQAMERKKPNLKIDEFCGALEKAKAFKVLRIVEKAIETNKIKRSDLVYDMWDNAAESFEQVILNLDKRGVWRDVAKSLDFTRKDCQSFERDMDPASNLTRDLFDVLRTQRPRLPVKVFKQKLKDIEQEGVLKIIEDHSASISDDDLLRELTKQPNIMLEIEHILNDPQDSSLWQLAKSFEADGLTIDVEMFRHRGTDANPTYHLMEHVIARSPEEQKIKDLIKHLFSIERTDCFGIIVEYLQGGEQEIDRVCREITDRQSQSPGEERQDASERDNGAGCNTP